MEFKRHDARERHFLVVVENLVYRFVVMLTRWKCSVCKRTFTQYPSFASPYKRFVIATIKLFSGLYLEREEATYRAVVCPEGMGIGYEGGAGEIDERQLSHSTPWHWLSWLGGMKQRLEAAMHLLRQRNGGRPLFCALSPIPPRKYQSEDRRDTLYRVQLFLRTGEQFLHFFSRDIFPRICNPEVLDSG